MKHANKKWEVQRRLEEIDRCLYWAGSMGRNNLIKAFGISPQQASADIKMYLEDVADTVFFDGSSKRYYPTDNFLPSLINTTIHDYLSWNKFDNYSMELIPHPYRPISPEILSEITRALQQNRSITINYQSMTHAEGTQRAITPHNIVFNGARYHIRAYCHATNSFRDFVFGRIISTGKQSSPGLSRTEDDDWNTLIIVRIGPHPKLTQDQKQVIENDYAMKDGESQINVRRALLLYFLNQLSLDGQEKERPPVSQQVVLLNPEIYQLL